MFWKQPPKGDESVETMTTTDQIKFIVGILAEPPFNKTYNLISFDSLEVFTLLQTLSDVVLTIEDKVGS